MVTRDRLVVEVGRDTVEIKEWLKDYQKQDPGLNLPSAFSFHCPRVLKDRPAIQKWCQSYRPLGESPQQLVWSVFCQILVPMHSISALLAFYFSTR